MARSPLEWSETVVYSGAYGSSPGYGHQGGGAETDNQAGRICRFSRNNGRVHL
jgi:hypothetical protein